MVARLFLGYSRWLLGCCYAITMVFLVSRTLLALKVAARVLLCNYSGVFGFYTLKNAGLFFQPKCWVETAG